MREETNRMWLTGVVVSDFEFDHVVCGEKFYKAMVRSDRNSGVADIIPIVVSERLMDMSYSWLDIRLKLYGQFRSYGKHQDSGHTKLELFLFVQTVEQTVAEFENRVELDGYVVKEPKYRETLKGRYITDIFIAVNRAYDKSDYLPLILWERNAALASRFNIGTHIGIVGRVQSREYVKVFEDGSSETRVAYEVSVRDVWEV